MLTLWVDCLKAFTEYVAEPRESETDATIEKQPSYRDRRCASSGRADPRLVVAQSGSVVSQPAPSGPARAKRKQRRSVGDRGATALVSIQCFSAASAGSRPRR